MRTRIIHLINPKTDSLNDPPGIYESSAVLSACRLARSCRIHSTRPVRSGAHRREHRDDRLRFEGGPRRDFRDDELRQPRL